MRKHFCLGNGIKIMLNECDLSLTYLNVYKKNHLKLLINTDVAPSDTSTSAVTDNQQLYEEALQARAK